MTIFTPSTRVILRWFVSTWSWITKHCLTLRQRSSNRPLLCFLFKVRMFATVELPNSFPLCSTNNLSLANFSAKSNIGSFTILLESKRSTEVSSLCSVEQKVLAPWEFSFTSSASLSATYESFPYARMSYPLSPLKESSFWMIVVSSTILSNLAMMVFSSRTLSNLRIKESCWDCPSDLPHDWSAKLPYFSDDSFYVDYNSFPLPWTFVVLGPFTTPSFSEPVDSVEHLLSSLWMS